MGNMESEILSGDGGLKDILQLLKEQSRKMERLGMALKVIQDRMRQNTPTSRKGQPPQIKKGTGKWSQSGARKPKK